MDEIDALISGSDGGLKQAQGPSDREYKAVFRKPAARVARKRVARKRPAAAGASLAAVVPAKEHVVCLKRPAASLAAVVPAKGAASLVAVALAKPAATSRVSNGSLTEQQRTLLHREYSKHYHSEVKRLGKIEGSFFTPGKVKVLAANKGRNARAALLATFV